MASPFVEIEVDNRVVKVTNPDRVYFPESGATKRDLVDYYLSVGPGIVNALFERLGRNQSWILDVLGGFIRTGQADGSVRAGHVPTLAETLLLSCYGFVLSAHTAGTSLRRLDDELGTLIDGYLAP